ncbi:PAS domain S-box protein [Geobacter hydrogenophilus]|uniref:histidine kinase n=1 Tax=Geobacter hydrogenophilus TaxID=40983 RepID=A0A9W6FY08_9BACT|nr:PAS domain S-box protein [Geobacter hydrogenophilus]MBT0895046.1 PAS domain S-box protein [Geobacter hydrogenophilus]GLI36981.1 PAS domain-containing sensor histidine kinase [Geobacter hydrogenophilus]
MSQENDDHRQRGAGTPRGPISTSSIDLEKARLGQPLKIKDEQFRHVERLKDFAIYTLDIKGDVQSWNAGAERMKGYRVEEIVGKHFSCFYTEEDISAGRPEEQLKMATAKGQITDEGWQVHKEGSRFWAEVILTALHDEKGNLQGFSKVTRDISGRTEAEEALRVSEEYYRTLFANNPSMIFTLNAELTTLQVSPIGASFLGYTPAELEGRSVLVLVHKDDRPSVAEQLQWCRKNPNQVHRLQFQTVRKNGSRVWVLEIAQGVYDIHGSLNILVVCQDISDLKQAEAEIQRLNAELAARAAELEVSNKELETFNFTVAHDLRQPLNVISLICQKIIMQYDADRLEESSADIESIRQVTLRMDKLIGALLNFSRIGYVEPLRVETDLSRMAHETVAEITLTEPERQVDFRIADGLKAYADASLLRLVLDNLLGNAWKYTREQEKVVIEFGLADIDGVPAYFVRDNGSGFVKEGADRLFVPFQRLPGAEKAIGFGIGLATVERIIRRHGGRVWAESELGKGATVYFTISAQDVTL